MDKGILWVKQVLQVCNDLENYTDEERNLVFSDINAMYAGYDSTVQSEIRDILLTKMDLEVAMTVMSVLIKNGGADQWMPFYIQIAENIKLDNKVYSALELQMHTLQKMDRAILQTYHKRNVQRWKERITLHASWRPLEKRNSNRIVIVTEQLLSELHAPTKAVLDMAYLLQHRMHYEVMIVVLPTDTPEIGQIWDRVILMASEERYVTNGIKREYKNESFWGYQIRMSEACNQDYSLLLSYILEWNPLFVYNFGVINPIADLLAEYTTIVAQSMSTSLPITEAQILVSLEEKITDESAEKKDIVQFNRTPLYFGEEKRVHTREEYGIEPNQFLCVVVGNRLEEEMDEDFIQMLQTVCDKNLNIAFVIIGHIENKKELQDKLRDKQIYYLDYCDDLLGIYKIMNLYVNPDRNGGGYSAAMAIASGLPAVSCNRGDVAYHVGSDFLVSDYNEMQQEILHYAEDSMYRALQQKQAEKCAESMTEDNMYQGMQDNINKIIKEIMQ